MAPITRRPHLDATAIAVLVFLTSLWGLQQVSVKVTIQEGLSPSLQAALRSLGAAVCVFAWIAATEGRQAVRALVARRTLLPGLGVAVGSGTTWRLPVGVSAGHTLSLDEGMAITPFVHPRLSLDGCGRCRRDDDSQLTLGVDVDLGAQWRVREALALTAALSFSGSAVVPNEPMLGVAIRWTPAALK